MDTITYHLSSQARPLLDNSPGYGQFEGSVFSSKWRPRMDHGPADRQFNFTDERGRLESYIFIDVIDKIQAEFARFINSRNVETWSFKGRFWFFQYVMSVIDYYFDVAHSEIKYARFLELPDREKFVSNRLYALALINGDLGGRRYMSFHCHRGNCKERHAGTDLMCQAPVVDTSHSKYRDEANNYSFNRAMSSLAADGVIEEINVNEQAIIGRGVDTELMKKLMNAGITRYLALQICANEKATAYCSVVREVEKIKEVEVKVEVEVEVDTTSLCGICCINQKNRVMVPCGHTICDLCLSRVRATTDKCQNCRTQILGVINMFL